MGQGRVIPKSEWAEMSVPDVYFSYGYHRASALLERDFEEIVLLEWSDEGGKIYLPLILRSVAGTDYRDATSAYGYGGPWFEGTPKTDGFRDFLNDWAKRNFVVASFLRFHPLIDNSNVCSDVFPVTHVGPTAGWDLARSPSLFDGMAKGHRKTWRKADRAGIEAKVTLNPSSLEDFVDLYQTSMNRLSADDFYLFSDDYWAALNKLTNSILLVEAVLAGETIAAALCLFGEEYLHFHLSGTTDEGRKLGGAVFCRLAAAEWAQESGLSLGHFGGGLGGENSSLLAWKQKFDEDLPLFQFSISKIIHDDIRYEILASSCPNDGYFPPWRDPKVNND